MAAEDAAFTAKLTALGWCWAEDEDDIPRLEVGTMLDGASALVLHCLEPVVSNVAPEGWLEVERECMTALVALPV